ncbi:MAG: hypothetical protein ACC707_05395, partial [Thiohalomonadales bacterium]
MLCAFKQSMQKPMKFNFTGILLPVCLLLFINNSYAGNSAIPQHPTELGPKSLDRNTIENFKKSYPNSVIHAFIGNEKFHSSRLQRSYFTNAIEPFYGVFFIGNYTANDIKFTLNVFIDYQQYKFSISKNKLAHSIIHKITVRSGSELLLPLSIEGIPEGAHDIIITAIQDKPIGKYVRSRILSHRANLYVKYGEFNKVEYKLLSGNIENKIMDIVINKNKEPNSVTPLIKLDNTKNDKYFIHVNNPYQVNTNYSLIVLLNSQQIPIINMENEKVIYF